MDRYIFAALLITLGAIALTVVGVPALEWYADVSAVLRGAR